MLLSRCFYGYDSVVELKMRRGSSAGIIPFGYLEDFVLPYEAEDSFSVSILKNDTGILMGIELNL